MYAPRGDPPPGRTRLEATLVARRAGTIIWFDFNTLDEVRERLLSGKSRTFGVSGVPNARVSADLALAESLRSGPASQPVVPQEQVGCLPHPSQEQIRALEALLQ